MSAIIENNLQVNLSQCLPTSKKKSKGKLLQTLMAEANTWIARSRQRKQLAKLDDHLLKDIGYSRSQVQKEISKPFWKQ